MIKILCVFAFAFVLFLYSCTKHIEELPPAETKVIGHRGSGKTAISNYQENTYISVKNAFQKLHGAEVDVQCSKDGTIWLFHDADLPDNKQGLLCVPGSSDEELIKFANRDTLFTLTKLEEIFVLMTQMENTPFLSLDVKGHFPNKCFESDNAPTGYFDAMVKSLGNLLDKYNLQDYLMVETDYQYFLDEMSKNEPQIDYYLLGYDNFKNVKEVAIKKGYDGISYNFKDSDLSKDDIVNARENGLRVQLWTLYNEDDFEYAIKLGADFLQTGNVELGKKYIKK